MDCEWSESERCIFMEMANEIHKQETDSFSFQLQLFQLPGPAFSSPPFNNANQVTTSVRDLALQQAKSRPSSSAWQPCVGSKSGWKIWKIGFSQVKIKVLVAGNESGEEKSFAF